MREKGKDHSQHHRGKLTSDAGAKCPYCQRLSRRQCDCRERRPTRQIRPMDTRISRRSTRRGSRRQRRLPPRRPRSRIGCAKKACHRPPRSWPQETGGAA
eukprot:2406143-Pyramimonas_sp.AAC.1